jgi:hypothetical protein
MIRNALQKYWTLFISIAALFVGVMIAISSQWGGGLGHLQNNSQPVTVLYWAVLFYESVALPLTGMLLIVILILIISLVIQVFRAQHQQSSFATAGIFLSLVAFLVAAISIFPIIFVGYVHLDGADFAGHRYNLGVKTPFDGDLVYIVGKCDRLGIRCDCYAVGSVESSNTWEISRLKQDASTQALAITMGDQTVLNIPSKLLNNRPVEK